MIGKNLTERGFIKKVSDMKKSVILLIVTLLSIGNVFGQDATTFREKGDVALYADHYNQAVAYYKKALSYSTDKVPVLFQLAKAYSWDGKLDEAIKTYREILKIDNTYSEAWQGIGKMYYWKEQPQTALSYYEKAIALDPEELPIQKEYEMVKSNLKYELSASFDLLEEKESSYLINATVQKYGVRKQIGNHLSVAANILLDHSNRDFVNTDAGDTVRWYQNAWVKLGWMSQHHKVYAYAGYSPSDELLSAYGVNWKANYQLGKIGVSNSLSAGYDYFYYWNRVGQNAVSDNITFSYKKFKLNVSGGVGEVDTAFLIDTPNDNYFVGKNPHNEFGVSLRYQLLKKPLISIAANYSLMKFKYTSAKYYSPLGRQLYGPSLSIYYPVNQFYFYGSFSYDIGTDYYYELEAGVLDKIDINVDGWSGDSEIGYSWKSFSVGLTASRFYNDYYSNFKTGINLKYLL